jgi:monofunctional biosynthetic peptidoglycan transglycosylase
MKTILSTIVALFILFQTNEKHEGKVITDFSNETNLEWFIINDGVMGGLSESTMTSHKNGYGIFSGNVSLENNGGFASVRARIPGNDYSVHDKIVLRVKGDGKKYQFRIRTNQNFDGVSYQANFTAKPGEWQIVEFSENDFTPVWRGRVVKDYPALDFANMRQIGFLIADYQKGGFELMVDEIVIR